MHVFSHIYYILCASFRNFYYFCGELVKPIMQNSRITNLFIMAICCLTWAASDAFAYNDHRDRKTDSLEMVFTREDLSYRQRLSAHSDLMWGYLQTDKEASIRNAQTILNLTDSRNLPSSGEGLLVRHYAFRLIGQHAYADCLYDSAMNCYERAEEVAEGMQRYEIYTERDIDDVFSSLYATIGNLYNIQGMTTIALDYYLKALGIFQRHGWHESESILYYNVGEMFLEMGNNAEAGKYYRQAKTVAGQTGDSLIISIARNGLIMALLNDGNYDEAMAEARANEEYFLSHMDQERGSYINNKVNMARLEYHCRGDIAQAQHYLDDAFGEDVGEWLDNADLSDLYAFQSELCVARGQWLDAVAWGKRALETNDQDPHHNEGIFRHMAEAYANMGQSQLAVAYMDSAHQILQSIANEQHQSTLGEMQIRYRTEQKEQQLRQLQQRQQLMLWIGVAAAVVFVLIMAFVIFYQKQRQKVVAIQSKLAGERDERQRLARDLHDRLGGMLTATRLQIEQGKNNEAVNMLHETTQEVRRISHHLMPASLSSDGLHVAVGEYCNILPSVSYLCVGMPVRYSAHFEVLCYSVIHELINNALRHSAATGIQVQLMFEAKQLSAIVADDGCGFDTQAEHQGSGLRNIKERIASAGGNLSISSGLNKGTEVLFSVKDNA